MAAFDFPSNPAPNQIVAHPDGRRWQWTNDSHWVALGDDIPIDPGPGGGPTTMPIAFAWAGRPPDSGVINIPITVAATIPANLADTQGYARVAANAPQDFMVYRNRGGTLTQLGTVRLIAETGGRPNVLSGSGGDLAAGDILTIVTPASTSYNQNFADVGITIQAVRA